MKNNQGVTLVELIVVMLIIGILAGGAMVGIRGLDSGNTRSTMKRIDALLTYVRVLNMSKVEDYNLSIKCNSGVYVANIQSGTNIIMTEKLKLQNGDITYINSSDLAFSIASGKELIISYKKDSGSINADPDDGYIKSIMINGGGRSYTIRLVTATGKHYIE